MQKMKMLDLQKVKRILVLNMLSTTIGDVVLLTPIFKILKDRLPDRHINVTTSNITKKFFENNPSIDEIITIINLNKIGKGSGISRIKKLLIYVKIILKLAKELRKRKFDLCIVAWPNFSLMQIIPWLSNIKHSIGYTYKGSYFSFLLTKKCEYKDAIHYPKRHFVESYFDLLRLIGIEPKKEEKYVEIFLNKHDKERARKILKECGVRQNDTIITVQAGAGWPNKTWPYQNFIEVVKQLIEYKKDVKIVLLGSPSEFEMNEKIRQSNPEKIINFSGKISLDDVPGVINQSKLMIGNDSGLVHIAGAVGVPVIVLHGDGNPKYSRVLGKKKSIAIFKNDFCKPCMRCNPDCELNYKCMTIIKPEDVMNEVKKIL